MSNNNMLNVSNVSNISSQAFVVYYAVHITKESITGKLIWRETIPTAEFNLEMKKIKALVSAMILDIHKISIDRDDINITEINPHQIDLRTYAYLMDRPGGATCTRNS